MEAKTQTFKPIIKSGHIIHFSRGCKVGEDLLSVWNFSLIVPIPSALKEDYGSAGKVLLRKKHALFCSFLCKNVTINFWKKMGQGTELK